MEKGLLGFIDGSELPPEDDDDSPKARATFKSRSEKAYSLIAMNLEQSVQIHVMDTTNPMYAWEILEEQFSFVSVAQKVRLSRKFYTAKMEENDDLMEHLSVMGSLAQQLRELDEDISSHKFATTVLGSLPPSYDNFVTSLNARNIDDFHWDAIKGALMEEDSKRKEKRNQNNRDDVFFTGSRRGGGHYGGAARRQQRFGGNNRSNSNQQHGGNHGGNNGCYNCGQFGHIARNCQNRITINNQQRNGYNNNSGNNVHASNNHHSHYRSGNNGNRSDRDQGNFVGDNSGSYGRRDNNQWDQGNFVGDNRSCYGGNENRNRWNRQQGNFIGENNGSYGGHTNNRWAHDQGNFVGAFRNMTFNDDDNNQDFALATNNHAADQSEWFIDSAASKHMTFKRDALTDFVEYENPHPIGLGDDHVLLASGHGNLRVQMVDIDSGNQFNLTLSKVLYVPKIKKNLISVGQMAENGAEVYFDKEKCVVNRNYRCVTIGTAVGDKLYLLNNVREQASFVKKAEPTAELWHYRFGHLNKSYLHQLAKDEMVTGMSFRNDDFDKCEPCILGKMKRSSIPKKSFSRSSKPLELIHSDVCGPLQTPSHGGSKYFVSFTDDYSRYSTVYFMKNKSEVLSKFKEFMNVTENKTGHRIQRVNTIRSDNGGEYTSDEFNRFCMEIGIDHQYTNPYTPEQNGVSERYNRTVMEAARSMLIHSSLPLQFWAEAVNTANYLRNRSPTSALSGKTPFECWYGKRPDVSNLRVFGCISYSHIPKELRRKLDPKSEKCVFVGYPDGTKGYKLFNLKSRKFMRSLSIQFCEDEFHDWEEKTNQQQYARVFHGSEPEDEIELEENESQQNNNEPNDQIPVDVIQNPEINSEDESNEESYEDKFLKEAENLGKKRDRKTTKRLVDELASFAGDYCFLTSLITEPGEPTSLEEALNDPNWYNAMKSEMASLEKNETWELVPRPKNKNIIKSKWVHKIKRNSDGSINRYKSRLVAQGYSQVHGVDYNEIFSPVARFSTIRSLLAVANANDFDIHQMDVETAFLNGRLDYEIYMEEPKGFVDPERPDYVCKLIKSLYGLKQSARCWNVTLDEYLTSEEFIKSDADDCVYVKFEKIEGEEYFIIFVVYVDDMIPISNNTDLLLREKSKIRRRFAMVDNGDVGHLLGMQIMRDRTRRMLTISQKCYFEGILSRFNMENCNPVDTPMETGRKFRKLSDDDVPFNDVQLYQQAVGCLMYAATTTRPDIAAAIGILAQYMSAPSTDHWSGVKRVLRYIKGTQNYGLLFSSDGEDALFGYSDSDWAGDMDTRRSTSGYTFFIGNSLVSWSSQKQKTVAKSSTEAEYVALSFATQEVIWLRRLLESIGSSTVASTIIYEDNQGAIELSRNPKHHNRTKHIDTSYHFTRERVASNEISVTYCPTSNMIADTMTKPLPKVLFEKFRDMMGVCKL